MPYLTCYAYTCTHNREGRCSLSVIGVCNGLSEGGACSRYCREEAHRKEEAPAVPKTGICCDAGECVHNVHCACYADRVEVIDASDGVGMALCESYCRDLLPKLQE